MHPRFAASATRHGGFTLIELVIVFALIATLAAVAVPTYADHVRRSRIVEAVTRLADHRVRMEQYFLDYRRYDDGAGNCGLAVPPLAATDAFAYACTASTGSYTVSATGMPAKGMQGFIYTVDETDARRTPAVPDGWVASRSCWVLRRDGSCG
jgi:type IV pilus assembly protein PilE